LRKLGRAATINQSVSSIRPPANTLNANQWRRLLLLQSRANGRASLLSASRLASREWLSFRLDRHCFAHLLFMFPIYGGLDLCLRLTWRKAATFRPEQPNWPPSQTTTTPKTVYLDQINS